MDVLESSDAFQGLTQAQLERIAALSRAEVYPPGSIIFREGAEASKLYVVVEGRVALEMLIQLGPNRPGRQTTVEVVGRGGVLAWSALVEPYVLTLTARSVESTRVLAIDATSLRALVCEDSILGFVLMQGIASTVSRRLREARRSLISFLAIVSHDLKAPLAAVESYLQVILGGFTGELNEKQRTMMERSSQRLQELMRLIDELLEISRIESGQIAEDFETLDMRAAVQSCVDDLRAAATERSIDLRLEAPEGPVEVFGSELRLRQVIQNLLSNGLKFTEPGGVVALRLDDQRELVVVEVIDSGIGISAEDLPFVFDDFYRGQKVASKGAGLGLSIAKKIIDAHGGVIWAESPPKQGGLGSRGTKVAFSLPKKKDAERGPGQVLKARSETNVERKQGA